jgi:hypothetical protein
MLQQIDVYEYEEEVKAVTCGKTSVWEGRLSLSTVPKGPQKQQTTSRERQWLKRDQRVKRQTVFVNHLKGAQQQQRDKQGMEYGRLQWCVFACLCECGCGFVCICVPVCLCVRQQTDSII